MFFNNHNALILSIVLEEVKEFFFNGFFHPCIVFLAASSTTKLNVPTAF